jgi:hypothetical protein
MIHILTTVTIHGHTMTLGGGIPIGGWGLVFIPITIIIIRTIISEREVILTEVEDLEFSTAPLGTEDLREGEAAVLQEEAGEAIDDVQLEKAIIKHFFSNPNFFFVTRSSPFSIDPI